MILYFDFVTLLMHHIDRNGLKSQYERSSSDKAYIFPS